LGYSQTTLADIITEITDNALSDVPSTSMMAQAIANATNKITGNSGGYVILHKDANGQPYELLVMDSPNINTAVNVWRWNLGGLGFSSTGYNGDFSSVALTMDGQINADLITVGTLSANRIKGGVLQLGGEDNGNGVLQLRTAD
jgi:phage-related protein